MSEIPLYKSLENGPASAIDLEMRAARRWPHDDYSKMIIFESDGILLSPQGTVRSWKVLAAEAG